MEISNSGYLFFVLQSVGESGSEPETGWPDILVRHYKVIRHFQVKIKKFWLYIAFILFLILGQKIARINTKLSEIFKNKDFKFAWPEFEASLKYFYSWG